MKKVAIIDSGSGGVNVLLNCIKQCKNCNYLLLIDDKNLPYGNKTEIQLKKIAFALIERLNSFFKPDIVVIGCNTLTSVCIEDLRACFKDIFFIGSEPALKPALKEFVRNDILVLATSVTINNCKILNDYKNICFCPPELPKVIDDNLFEREKILDYLEKHLDFTKPKAVVLGCTHFEGIQEELSKVLGKPKFFLSSEGIASRLRSQNLKGNSFQVQIMTTSLRSDQIKFYSYFKYRLNQFLE